MVFGTQVLFSRPVNSDSETSSQTIKAQLTADVDTGDEARVKHRFFLVGESLKRGGALSCEFSLSSSSHWLANSSRRGLESPSPSSGYRFIAEAEGTCIDKTTNKKGGGIKQSTRCVRCVLLETRGKVRLIIETAWTRSRTAGIKIFWWMKQKSSEKN